MTTGIHETTFLDRIAQGCKVGPTARASVLKMASGAEQRNLQWARMPVSMTVGTGLKRADDVAWLIRFFRARRGNVYGFLMRDWSDYAAAAQALGTGDGSNKLFPLLKTYTESGYTFTRAITRPRAVSEVRVNGVAQPSGWTVATGGILTFTAAPPSGHVVSASFTFDITARFDTAELPLTLHHYNLGEWVDCPIVEIPDA